MFAEQHPKKKFEMVKEGVGSSYFLFMTFLKFRPRG